MSYREFIINELSKTGLKPNSIKLYSIKLNKLHKDLKIEDINNEFLNDYNKIIEYLDSLKSVDDKLANLNAIIKILDNNELKLKYIELRTDLNKIKFDNYKDNIKSNNFVDYQELLDISKNVNFSSKNIKEILNDILLYISVRYPIRLQLSNIRIIKNKKNIKPDINYIYITVKKAQLIMQDFKNINSLGKTIIDIDNEDFIIIKEYLKFMKHFIDNQEFLLYNYHNKLIPYTSDIYARTLKTILNKKLNKDLTMNDIRKSYETNLINSDLYKTLTNNEKDIMHKRLLHSMGIAHRIYNKV